MVLDSGQTKRHGGATGHGFIGGDDDARRESEAIVRFVWVLSDGLSEVDAFFRSDRLVIKPFTVREILDETIARTFASFLSGAAQTRESI